MADERSHCKVCGDPMDKGAEMHHPTQPTRGADPDKVEPLHPDCRAWITGLQKMGVCAAGPPPF